MFEDKLLLSQRLAKKRRVQAITRFKLSKLLNLIKFKKQDNLLNSLLCFISVSWNHQPSSQLSHLAGISLSHINRQQQDQMKKQWKLCPLQELFRSRKSVIPHHLLIRILKCLSKAWWEVLTAQIAAILILQMLFKRDWCVWLVTKNHQGNASWWQKGHHPRDQKFSSNSCHPLFNLKSSLQLSRNQPLNNHSLFLAYLIPTAVWAVLEEFFQTE